MEGIADLLWPVTSNAAALLCVHSQPKIVVSGPLLITFDLVILCTNVTNPFKTLVPRMDIRMEDHRLGWGKPSLS